MSVPPRVFVSHASEDKERFVTRFATALREKGIDAWLDRWEMLPGDSLVDKIFEEGLKSAAAVIVVLSDRSVGKSWVKEELNTATVNRINRGTKLIPVVLGRCEIPESLRSTVWETVSDLNDIDSTVDRIVAAIFEIRDKPAIGRIPPYARASELKIAGLTQVDSFVLARSCEWALSHEHQFLEPNTLFGPGSPSHIAETIVEESLEVLDQQGFINLKRVLAKGPHAYSVTISGLESYLSGGHKDYQRQLREVALQLVNSDLRDNQSIAKASGIPAAIVSHIFNMLENQGHIKQSRELSTVKRAIMVHPSLRRALY